MTVANLNDPNTWREEAVTVSHLAQQLNRGRLAILLGAGVSQFYGLPDWRTLVDRLSARLGVTALGPDDDPLVRVAALRERRFRTNTRGFLEAVQEELYRDTTDDFEKIRKNQTLSAIGALVMASRRGSASKVVTLNYDDLLETYLEYHGYVTSSIFTPRHWVQNSDITIYHPHGYLPRNRPREWSDDIVFGTDDYLKIMKPDSSNLWHPLLGTILRTHTFIYIGLSGYDIHLQSLVASVAEAHPVRDDRIAFHGVRVALKSSYGSDIDTMMNKWGVHSHFLDSYDDVPPFLFKVCQAARKARIEADN